MHDHNLDDLIIGNIQPENSKTKSFLTIVALFIVVIIVGIVLAKVLLKTPKDNTLALEENMTEMIAPELKLQETPQEPEASKDTSLSNLTQNETPQTPDQNTSIDNNTSVLEDNTLEPETTQAEDNQTTDSGEDIQEAEEGLSEAVEITDEYAQTPKAKKKPAQEKKPVKKPHVVKTPIKKPEPIKHQKTKTPKFVAQKPASSHTYYIQVGSFTSEPSARFLSSVQSSGFGYKITGAGANGAKKLLIGPYSDKDSAQNALVNVKDRINKSAFVTDK